MPTPLPRRAVAEMVGTFFLVFVGCGAIIIDAQTGGGVGSLGIGISWGLIVMTMIYTIGESSGAHINPAVTLGFVAAKRFPKEEAPVYIAAQILGAIAAALALRALFPGVEDLGQTYPRGGTLIQSAVMEVVITCMLMYVILGVCSGAKEKGLLAGVAIGGVVGMAAIFAGPICRASMNPARSIGPALVAMDGKALATLWFFLAGPVLGALLAVVLFRVTHAPDSSGRDPEGKA